MLDRRSRAQVNFGNGHRAPLLLIAGGADNVIPPGLNKSNYRKYSGSPATTAFKEFPGRCHWIIAQDGWEEVASYIADWLGRPVE